MQAKRGKEFPIADNLALVVLREIEKDNALRDSRRSQKPKASEDQGAKTPEPAPPTTTPKPTKTSSSAFY